MSSRLSFSALAEGGVRPWGTEEDSIPEAALSLLNKIWDAVEMDDEILPTLMCMQDQSSHSFVFSHPHVYVGSATSQSRMDDIGLLPVDSLDRMRKEQE